MLPCAATRYTLARPLPGVSSRRFRHTGAIERLKNPTRGGQNLSERFLRLEKSLRGKSALLQDLDTPPVIEGEVSARPSSIKKVEMFRGFVIPKKPRMPADDECCMSGCAVCVYDLYEDSLDEYKEKVAALHASLSSLNIPELEWPDGVRSAGSGGGAGKRKDAILNAFEEMERALKEKQSAKVSAGYCSDVKADAEYDLASRYIKKKKIRKQFYERINELYEVLLWYSASARSVLQIVHCQLADTTEQAFYIKTLHLLSAYTRHMP